MKELLMNLLEFLRGLNPWIQALLVLSLLVILLLVAINPATGAALVGFIAGLTAILRGTERAK